MCGEGLFYQSRKDHVFLGENEVQVDQRKLCSSGLSAHYYSWMLAKGPNEIPACAYCQEPLEYEKIDKLNTLLKTKKGHRYSLL